MSTKDRANLSLQGARVAHSRLSVQCTMLCAVLLAAPLRAADFSWSELWQTPEQRAQAAFESGNAQALIDQALDPRWSGLGHYRSGDYNAAAEEFSRAVDAAVSQGDRAAASRSRYNLGVSHVQAGRYQDAIEQFDTVLQDDPEFIDAQHNRSIAEQLMNLQQQNQQGSQANQPDDQPGKQQADESQPQQSGQQSGQQQGAESGQRQDQQAAQQGQDDSQREAGNTTQGSSNSQSSDSGAAEELNEQDAQDAVKALAAEAAARSADDTQDRANAAKQAQDTSSQSASAASGQRPMSESEQATEQWLRRIPDDPAGLLRRKLEQSHRNEYPEVRDAVEPW